MSAEPKPVELHECAHPECSKLIGLGLYACRPHWFSLPRDIRQAISSAWHLITCGVARGIDRHAAATADAVNWWRLHP